MRIYLAVNDENGNPSGRIEKIDFESRGEIVMELELNSSKSPLFSWSSTDSVLYIGRKAYRYVGYTSWAGSMTFDAVTMTRKTAEELAEDLRKSGKWHCSVAHEDVFSAWEKGEKIYL